MRVIIPFRAWDAGRTEGARFVVRALQGFGLVVTVVEQDVVATPLGADKHVTISDRGPFNRCMCLNAGVLSEETPNSGSPLLFLDADILLSGDAIRRGRDALSEFDAVSPFNEVYDLNEAQTAKVFAGHPPGTAERRRGVNLAGGALLLRYDVWLALGGWDERMVGWGGEDDLMSTMIERLGFRVSWLHQPCLHLWHARRSCPWDHYRNNCEHLDRMRRASVDEIRNDAAMRSRALVERASTIR